ASAKPDLAVSKPASAPAAEAAKTLAGPLARPGSRRDIKIGEQRPRRALRRPDSSSSDPSACDTTVASIRTNFARSDDERAARRLRSTRSFAVFAPRNALRPAAAM